MWVFSEPVRSFVSSTFPGHTVHTRTKAHFNHPDLICATCGFSVGLFDYLCVRFISLHDKYTVFSSLKCTPAGCLSVRGTQALIKASSPPGAPSRTKPGALKNSLSPAFWRNMAPVRPEHTAKLHPLNTRRKALLWNMTLWRLTRWLWLPRPCGAAMRDTAAASHCSRGVRLPDCFGVAAAINA